MFSEAMEKYLKVIFGILEGEKRATTSAIAERLGVAPASVTAMIKKLQRLKLVTYKPYYGVTLTKAGKQTALEIVRHHRLLELYLSEALGMPWDRVHEEAEKLEHVLSEELEDRMAAVLGDPAFDPHGAPIPGRDGTIQRIETRSLTSVALGEKVEVVEVTDGDPGLLRYLGGLKMFPGTVVRIIQIEPYHGPLKIRTKGREVVLGRSAAGNIRVKNVS
jgi:DtxR family transcriptional regulator, Mn-dependent transcriptional regulator